MFGYTCTFAIFIKKYKYTLNRYKVFFLSNYYSCLIKNKNVEHKTIRRKNILNFIFITDKNTH